MDNSQRHGEASLDAVAIQYKHTFILLNPSYIRDSLDGHGATLLAMTLRANQIKSEKSINLIDILLKK